MIRLFHKQANQSSPRFSKILSKGLSVFAFVIISLDNLKECLGFVARLLVHIEFQLPRGSLYHCGFENFVAHTRVESDYVEKSSLFSKAFLSLTI